MLEVEVSNLKRLLKASDVKNSEDEDNVPIKGLRKSKTSEAKNSDDEDNYVPVNGLLRKYKTSK